MPWAELKEFLPEILMTNWLSQIALIVSTVSLWATIFLLGRVHNKFAEKIHIEILKARKELFELQASIAIMRIDLTAIKFDLKKERKG